MSEPRRNKVERALAAMRDDVWTELQHRRVAKRLDDAALPAERRSRTRLWWAAGAAACVLALFVARSALVPAVGSRDAAVGSELEPARAVLSDGSVVDIDRGGRIRVVSEEPHGTRVEVLSGRAEFEVQRRPGRVFVAVVRGIEVRVLGTHFSTELDLTPPPGLVRVKVQRGTVEVAEPKSERILRLNAGDAVEVSLAANVLGKQSAEESKEAASAASAAVELPAASAASSVGQPAASPSVPALDASKLFETASEARRAGNVQAAASAYAALLSHFPSDDRAGVAALELGRLRMDSLHAYPAAAAAFRRAIAAAPNDGIREDALARLVEVLDRMHDRQSCLAEQRRYLARYALGVHSTSVKARCSEATR